MLTAAKAYQGLTTLFKLTIDCGNAALMHLKQQIQATPVLASVTNAALRPPDDLFLTRYSDPAQS